MRLVANPVMLRAMIVFVCSAFAFLMAVLLIRMLKQNISEEASLGTDGPRSLESLPLHVYNTVIQQLKQQKHELIVQSQAEQQRARTSENFSHAVLANLSSGVLVFGGNGLVKTANPAAKTILGFASPMGMNATDIFRGATGQSAELKETVPVSDEVHAVLREGSKRRQVESAYETPNGVQKFLSMTISAVQGNDGNLLGAACLINDRSELEGIRRQEELQGELSAEMALQLRTSLATIAGYAQQLASHQDAEMAKELAGDIAQEAAQLERQIGGFLTAKKTKAAVTH